MNETLREAVARLREENAALRRAIELLHQISNLARESLELRGVEYAVLTGVTAGVGLGFNRGMLFFVQPGRRDALVGAAAVGPRDRDEADRVWTDIERQAPDLATLYADAQQERLHPGPLDERVRATEISALGHTPVAVAFRTRSVVVGHRGDDGNGLFDGPTSIAAPLRGRSACHGVLYADNRFTRAIVEPTVAMVFGMVAEHAGRAIDNARHYEDVARAARTDALTGLPHHGALTSSLERAVDRADVDEQPLSIVMIDLDDFKRVNDRLGHLVGDRVLAAVAERLRLAARAGTVFRYGGEEFTALLHGASPADAEAVAERLRRAVRDDAFDVGTTAPLVVTCSLGVATLRPGESAEALLARADAALLRAKASGKNRVEAA